MFLQKVNCSFRYEYFLEKHASHNLWNHAQSTLSVNYWYSYSTRSKKFYICTPLQKIDAFLTTLHNFAYFPSSRFSQIYAPWTVQDAPILRPRRFYFEMVYFWFLSLKAEQELQPYFNASSSTNFKQVRKDVKRKLAAPEDSPGQGSKARQRCFAGDPQSLCSWRSGQANQAWPELAALSWFLQGDTAPMGTWWQRTSRSEVGFPSSEKKKHGFWSENVRAYQSCYRVISDKVERRVTNQHLIQLKSSFVTA